jgi:hypothetical protein
VLYLNVCDKCLFITRTLLWTLSNILGIFAKHNVSKTRSVSIIRCRREQNAIGSVLDRSGAVIVASWSKKYIGDSWTMTNAYLST